MRITGGAYKNKRIDVPRGAGDIRPTSDKMRQAIFNMLDHASWGMDLDGAVMLDGFCGSGIMGMEALSRGASHVTFADQSRKALSAVRGMLSQSLDVEAARYDIISCDLSKPRSWPQPAYNMIFLDPPYRKDLVPKTLDALHAAGMLTDQALCLCEAEIGAAIGSGNVPRAYHQEDIREYGDTKLVVLRYNAAIDEAE